MAKPDQIFEVDHKSSSDRFHFDKPVCLGRVLDDDGACVRGVGTVVLDHPGQGEVGGQLLLFLRPGDLHPAGRVGRQLGQQVAEPGRQHRGRGQAGLPAQQRQAPHHLQGTQSAPVQSTGTGCWD